MLQTIQSQTSRKLFRYSAIPLLLVALSCSGLTSKSRTSSQDKNESAAANSSVQNQSGNFTPSKNDEATPPEVVSGVYLYVSANCVGIQGEATPSCKSVRLGASVTVGSAAPVRFAKDTVAALGIKSSLSMWSFPDKPADVSCEFTEGGFAFNPLCKSDRSLAAAPVKAVLTIVLAADDSSVAGLSPSTNPKTGTVYGNFMLLDASAGLTPSGVTYSGSKVVVDGTYTATSAFSEIWQDLVSGLYLTNILYDPGISGGGGVDWADGDDICRQKVNSGDGAVSHWRLPTEEELCGADYRSYNCLGGLKAHEITSVTFAGGSWINYFWSSSPAPGDKKAWDAHLYNGNANYYSKSSQDYGVFCVRN